MELRPPYSIKDTNNISPVFPLLKSALINCVMHGKTQARCDLRTEPINSMCHTKPNRAPIQGREAVSPAAWVGRLLGSKVNVGALDHLGQSKTRLGSPPSIHS